jgi:hypothetical protein
MNTKKKISIILIIIFIIITITSIYDKYNSDILSDEDDEDLNITYQFMHPVPREKINNYNFVIRTSCNIVYENEKENIVKIFIRGTRELEDIVTDIKCYLSEEYISESSIYKKTDKLLQKYTNKKIYLIGHSLGATIVNRLANTYNTPNSPINIIYMKLFCPYFAFEKDRFYNINIHVIENKFDLVPYVTFIRKFVKSHDIKIIYKTLPTNTLEFLFLHKIRFFYNIYDDNNIFVMDIMVLISIIIILIYFY